MQNLPLKIMAHSVDVVFGLFDLLLPTLAGEDQLYPGATARPGIAFWNKLALYLLHNVVDDAEAPRSLLDGGFDRGMTLYRL